MELENIIIQEYSKHSVLCNQIITKVAVDFNSLFLIYPVERNGNFPQLDVAFFSCETHRRRRVRSYIQGV